MEGFTGVTATDIVTIYEFCGEPWRVERMDLLTAEIPEVSVSDLPRLHESLARHSRQWMVARRLWGIQPVVPPQTGNADDLLTLAASDLALLLGVTSRQIPAELTAVRAVVKAALLEPIAIGSEDLFDPPTAPESRDSDDGNLTFSLDDAALFARYDLVSPALVDDRQWLAKRIGEWRKVLDQAQAKPLAGAALDSMLQLRLIQREMAGVKTGGKEYTALTRLKLDYETALRSTMEQLDQIVPYFGLVAGKVSFSGVIADTIRATQEYHSKGTRRLADGIFTLTEIEVQLRRSTQRPDVQYRAAWVAYLNEARANLWNPNWKPRPDHKFIRRGDAAFGASIAALQDADGIRVPDLMSEDPVAGEYPELSEERA